MPRSLARSTKAPSIRLACSVCQTCNYTTPKSLSAVTVRLERKKYCPHCNQHTMHLETK